MFWKELMMKFVTVLKANAVSADLATNNKHSMVYILIFYFFSTLSQRWYVMASALLAQYGIEVWFLRRP